jgi:lysosomal acid lipase/cholesteryl ester hydrolase
VKPFIALAPVTSVGAITAPARLLAYADPLVALLSLKGGPFLQNGIVSTFAEHFCSVVVLDFQAVCGNLLFFLGGGWDSPQLNYTRIPVYVAHSPAGTSVQNMVHWIQGIKSGRFAKYDYGLIGNMKRYKSPVPPAYVLEKITNKNIAIFSSFNDGFADVTDVEILRTRLQVPLLEDYQVKDILWSHLDFIWAKSAGSVINNRVIDLLNRTA